MESHDSSHKSKQDVIVGNDREKLQILMHYS